MEPAESLHLMHTQVDVQPLSKIIRYSLVNGSKTTLSVASGK